MDTSNSIEIFSNPEFGSVRTLMIDDQPFFVGKDVATILGYANPTKAVIDHVADDDKKMGSQNVTPSITDALGRKQYPVWINESGLYSLILSSKLSSAQNFKHWITAEVLPSIRKHGVYLTADVLKQVIANPDFLIGIGKTLKEEKEKSEALANQVQVLAPKAHYCDVVLQSPSAVPTSEIAKDYGMGAPTFNKKLHEMGIQYKQGKIWFLYAKYQDKGYATIDTYAYVDRKTGETKTREWMKWTQKGRLFLYEKLKAAGILPVMEREDSQADPTVAAIPEPLYA